MASSDVRSGRRLAPPGSSPVRRPGTAVYSEVTRDLRERIDRGEYAPGERLPAETDLAHSYGVNRLTVRRALANLARAGVIRTKHGIGSFVREPVVRHRIDDGHASLSESMEARGLAVTHEVIAVEVLNEEAAAGYRFEHWPGQVVRFSYRRVLAGLPWSLSQAVMPEALAPTSWDARESLTAALRDRGTQVVRAERTFSAAAADHDDASWLGIELGSPVLVVRGLNTDPGGHDIMRLVHRTSAERAEYVVRLANNRRERP